MAQQVQVLLVDDIDGGKAAETVSFALDGFPTRSISRPRTRPSCAMRCPLGRQRPPGGWAGAAPAARAAARGRSGDLLGDARMGPEERFHRERARPHLGRAPGGLQKARCSAPDQPAPARRGDPRAGVENAGQRVLGDSREFQNLFEAPLPESFRLVELVPGARGTHARCVADHGASTAKSSSSPPCSGSSRAAPSRAARPSSSGRPRASGSRAPFPRPVLGVGPDDPASCLPDTAAYSCMPLLAARHRIRGEAVGGEPLADRERDLGALRQPGAAVRGRGRRRAGRACGWRRAGRPATAACAARGRPGWPARRALPGRRRTGRRAARGRVVRPGRRHSPVRTQAGVPLGAFFSKNGVALDAVRPPLAGDRTLMPGAAAAAAATRA